MIIKLVLSIFFFSLSINAQIIHLLISFEFAQFPRPLRKMWLFLMESKNAEKNSPIFKIKRKRLVSNKINVLELEP